MASTTIAPNFKQRFKDNAKEAFSNVPGDVFDIARGSAGSVVSGLIGEIFANRAYEREMRGNKELMDYQANINRQAVADQRAYNDPKAVAARARAAGVSATALLGGSPGSPGVSSLSAGASGSSVNGHRSGSNSSIAFARRLQTAQLENLESARNANDASAEQGRAQADEARARAADIRQQTTDRRWYNENVRELDRALKLAGVDEAEANAAIAQYRKILEDYRNSGDDPIAFQELRQKLSNLKQKYNLDEATIESLEASARKTSADAAYQEQVNEDYDNTGVTPNSSIAGSIALAAYRASGLVVSNDKDSGIDEIKNDLPSFLEKQFDRSVVGTLKNIAPIIHDWLKEHTKLSPEQRQRIIDAAIKAAESAQ